MDLELPQRCTFIKITNNLFTKIIIYRTTVTSTTLSGVPATGTLTFGQLEDLINKWTVDLEEQGKVYGNQARHLNAWDRLLISNGEKV